METDIHAQLQERLAQLPEIVRNAITSADVQKQLRAVSDNHKLHIDQWGKLENEVMLALLGFQDAAELPSNLQSEVGISAAEAASLASDINSIVFEPIRQELERLLLHPDAKAEELSGAESARKEILAGEAGQAPATVPQVIAPAVLPGTPPQPKPDEKAIRTPISASYTARQPSTDRKGVTGDPYRLPPV